MGICCNLAKIFLPTPSHLVYIEKLVINVSSSCSTYCRNDDDGIRQSSKILGKILITISLLSHLVNIYFGYLCYDLNISQV